MASRKGESNTVRGSPAAAMGSKSSLRFSKVRELPADGAIRGSNESSNKLQDAEESVGHQGFARLSRAMHGVVSWIEENAGGARTQLAGLPNALKGHWGMKDKMASPQRVEEKERSQWPFPNPFTNHNQPQVRDPRSRGSQAAASTNDEPAAQTEPPSTSVIVLFGVRLPQFQPRPRALTPQSKTARISPNPLVWATRQETASNAPKQSSELPKPPEQSPGVQQADSEVRAAGPLRGQTEAVLDSVKSAVAGISSNVMDNLPPLRKAAYPDRKKLSSVQEFYRYTEAEGRRLFAELDADGDGNVTLEDLEAAMRRRKLPQEYARKFLRKVRRGMFAKSFTWAEFSALMDEREPALLRAYNSLDLNSAGTLQRNQIKASLQRNGLPTTDRNINAMMRFLTGEADGQIAYGQFRNFLLLLPPERLRDHPSTVWFEAATVVPLYAPAVATGNVLKSALAGGLACAIPTFFLHPVDTMKTRVQASTMSLRDLMSQLPEIGARGLYRGAVPAIVGQFAGQGLRTGMLEASKAVLKNAAPDLPEMQVQSLASFTSTFLGTALRIPCEVLKQRCQAGLYDNWQSALVGTYRSDGLPGFFRGTTATLLREVPFYVAGMMIYEQIKKGVRIGIQRELKPWETITVGGVSGGLAAVTTTPFDVIKTRMMTAEPGAVASMGATFVSILKHEGVGALYKGALPRFFWIAPLGAMNFAGYELAKRAMEDKDRRQAREAEAAAAAELIALEEAEEERRRASTLRLPKMPNLPRLRMALPNIRLRLPRRRASSDELLVAGRVASLDGTTSEIVPLGGLKEPAGKKGEMVSKRGVAKTQNGDQTDRGGQVRADADGDRHAGRLTEAPSAAKTVGSSGQSEQVGAGTRPGDATTEPVVGQRRGFFSGVPDVFKRQRQVGSDADGSVVEPARGGSGAESSTTERKLEQGRGKSEAENTLLEGGSEAEDDIPLGHVEHEPAEGQRGTKQGTALDARGVTDALVESGNEARALTAGSSK